MKQLLVIEVWGVDPVPWTVPSVGVDRRNGKTRRFTTRSKKSAVGMGKYSLEDWQRLVRNAAADAMKKAGIESPLACPVHVRYEFYAVPVDEDDVGHLWDVGLRWDAENQAWKKTARKGKIDPDLTNIIKSTEDGLQPARDGRRTSALADDCKVRAGTFVAMFGRVPGVRVTISEIEPGDFGPRTAATPQS